MRPYGHRLGTAPSDGPIPGRARMAGRRAAVEGLDEHAHAAGARDAEADHIRRAIAETQRQITAAKARGEELRQALDEVMRRPVWSSTLEVW